MPKSAVVVLAVSVLAAIWAVAMMTSAGRVGYYYFFIYSEYYMGVIALVSLSITIMVGLVATDRLVLSIRQRVLLQSTHRTTGVIAVTALFVHVWTKIAEDHIRVVDAFIPFLSPGNALYVGFGTLSAWIMVLVMWTGIARTRFIGRGKPWMWRGIHAISYLMWPIALVHGLSAGRPAKAWVIVSYIICILLVLVGLAVRVSVSLNRRKDFSSTAASGGLKPVGKLVPTSAAVVKRGPRREERLPELAPVAVADSFQPAAGPPVQTAPPVSEEPVPVRGARFADEDLVAPRQRQAVDAFDEPTRAVSRRAIAQYEEVPPYEEEPAPRGRRFAGPEDDIEYDEPAPRARRYSAEDTGTRTRRPDFEDTSTRMRRPELEDTGARMRRADFEDTSTRMRRADLEDTGARMRRADLEDTGARMRRVEFEEAPSSLRSYDDEPAPRARRRADEPRYEEEAPRGRRRAESAGYDDVPRARTARYDEEPPRRGARFTDGEDAPRGRRADIDGADSGRHSRSEFVDLAGGAGYTEGDETPTLVDMASRRARRSGQQDPVGVPAGRGARRGGRGRADDEVADDAYWSQLRGEAN